MSTLVVDVDEEEDTTGQHSNNLFNRTAIMVVATLKATDHSVAVRAMGAEIVVLLEEVTSLLYQQIVRKASISS